MARSSRFPCRAAHCSELLAKPGYCVAHAGLAWSGSRSNDRVRASSTKRGYDARWQKVSKSYLASHPLCVSCGAIGIVKEAAEVDHIIPIQVDPMRKYDHDNWQALCKPCHTAKTNQDRVTYDLSRPSGGGSISIP